MNEMNKKTEETIGRHCLTCYYDECCNWKFQDETGACKIWKSENDPSIYKNQ